MDKIAKERKLEVGFITIIDILRMGEICRNQDRDNKDYEVYHKLRAREVEIELEDVIEILNIEEQIRKEKL